jgi:hypothetical protein
MISFSNADIRSSRLLEAIYDACDDEDEVCEVEGAISSVNEENTGFSALRRHHSSMRSFI